MGGNNNDINSGYGSGGDPRGRVQNQVAHQQTRYENQQGPLANNMAYNYGRGSEANYGDYTDIMNQYRGIASGGGQGGEGGGGGGGGAATWSPSTIGYKDPFNSYAGFTEFSQTGGYSPNDIANMRARGVSPIRSAYANAERELQRGRSLQGGYSPNMAAAQVKMAREQGQGAADATQNVEAGLAEARNRGRLQGLGGMSDIEKQRLGADLDVARFNAQAQMSAASSNAGAANAASAANMADRMNALRGMTSLYGTTPGMSNTFGNQAIAITGQGAQAGQGFINGAMGGGQLPGAWDQAVGRVGDVYGMGSTIAYPWLQDERNKQSQQPSAEDQGWYSQGQ